MKRRVRFVSGFVFVSGSYIVTKNSLLIFYFYYVSKYYSGFAFNSCV